jgi:hypothetical protein
MGEVLPMPSLGDVFVDVRGESRTMRVSYHAEHGVVVVSLWVGALCRGSFRMAADDVERFVATLCEMSFVGPAQGAAGGPAQDAEADPPPAPAEVAGAGPGEQTGDISGAVHASRALLSAAPQVA